MGYYIDFSDNVADTVFQVCFIIGIVNFEGKSYCDRVSVAIIYNLKTILQFTFRHDRRPPVLKAAED